MLQNRRLPCPIAAEPLAGDRPSGSPSICATATSSWSTAPISCRRMKRDAHAEYRAGHIPGAVFFDIDAISRSFDRAAAHAARRRRNSARPSARSASATSDTIVVYDSAGLYSARRGCGGRSASSAPRTSSSSTAGCRNGKRKAGRWRPATSKRAPRQIQGRDQCRRGRDACRRAHGADRRQRAGRRCALRPSASAARRRSRGRGCAPATCRARSTCPTPAGRERPPGRARAHRAKRSPTAASISTSRSSRRCGSGVTAAILTFALDAIGKEPKGLYDGSWAEWGARARSSRRTQAEPSAKWTRLQCAPPVALVTGGAQRHRPRHRAPSARRRLARRRRRSAESGLRRAFPRGSAQRVAHRRRRRATKRPRRRRSSRMLERFGRLDARGLQCRHHDPQAAAPTDARRMAPRARHQSDRDVSARARGREAAAQGATARSSPSPRRAR